MNHAELIERAVRFEKIDKVPFALLSAGTWAISRQGYGLEDALALDAPTVANWLYEGYSLAGSAISWVGSGYNNVVFKALGGKIKWRRRGTPDVEEPLFKSVACVDAFDPAIITKDADIQKIFDTTAELVKLEQGRRLVGGSFWGPFSIAGLLLGADNLMRLVIKDKVALDAIMRFSSELYLAYLQGYINKGARIVVVADASASGDMISRKHFETAVLPYIIEIIQKLSAQNLILGLHICGDIRDRLDLVADCGVQFMSLDYKVPLLEARAAFGGKVAFSGNINPVSIVQNGTEAEIISETLRNIEEGGINNGYIVMPGCDIPPATRLENVQLISKTVNEYKSGSHV